jgi:hypothetical protein
MGRNTTFNEVYEALLATGIAQPQLDEFLTIDRVDWINTAIDAGWVRDQIVHAQLADWRETTEIDLDADDVERMTNDGYDKLAGGWCG